MRLKYIGSLITVINHKYSLFFFITIFSFTFSINVNAQQSSKYNVLFIVVDDMTDRVDFLGNPEVATPNFRRLLSHGMLFTHAYAQYALCNPSRTAFLSGWRPDKTRIFDNRTLPGEVLSKDVKYLPDYFKEHGYRIERYGKITHSFSQNEIDWDYGYPDAKSIGNLRQQGMLENENNPPGTWYVINNDDEHIFDGYIARQLVKRLQQPLSQPCFYAVGFISTHEPFTPTLKYWNKIGNASAHESLPSEPKASANNNLEGNTSENIMLPATPSQGRKDVPSIAFTRLQDAKPADEWKKVIHAYDAEVLQMDAQLGVVLDEMDRQNLWKNTIVVFFADHGQHLGEHGGLWGKQTLFEESLHVPLIVCVPGKSAGTCSRLVELEDIYPTLTELCGLPPVQGTEGSSFVRLLDNPNLPWKKAVFSQVNRPWLPLMGRSIRTEQYRYTSWGSYTEELYDHNTDSHEYINLAKDPAYSTVLNNMREILKEGWIKAPPPQ